MTRTQKYSLFFCLTASLISPTLKAQPQTIGWVEDAILLPEGVVVKAKMDTGALTSSMDAKSIKEFQKNDQPWVRFRVELKDNLTKQLTAHDFERPLVRMVKLRGAGGVDRRPVVVMSICIGSQRYDEEFSLRNRSKMVYPVLIGRRTLEHIGPIDVSRSLTLEPHCPA